MLAIYQGVHFLLTEAVKKTASQNRLTDAVTVRTTASVNSSIFGGGLFLDVRLG
jgi:hypothetical protein